jgi:predicted DNA binding CopG/RHH family protein
MSEDRQHDTYRDDAQLADELEKAMNDPTEWGEPIDEGRPRRSEKRQRAAMISIRLSPEELSAVQEEATARGVSVSRYVRECALRPSRPKIASSLGFLLASGTSTDRATSLGTLLPAIDVPTVTAPSPGVYYNREVISSAGQ